ncbi:MAG: hypothetical protein GX624_01635 [Actinobacteria bacterium]|nr:hypothetical protein [Actinomycetota bacterium]
MDSYAHRYARRLTLTVILALVVAGAVVAAAVAPEAAAEPAEPTDTSILLDAQQTRVDWNTVLILNGTLVANFYPPVGLDGQEVRVERATGASGPWTLVTTVTNASGPYYTGTYTYSEKATRTYFWRMVFDGTAEYGPSTSNWVKIGVVPRLGKPAAPAKAKVKKKFTVKGSLKPRFKAGSRSVKLRWQIRKNGAWKNYKTTWAKVANAGSYSKYTAKIAVPRAGKFRFYAFAPATAKFVKGTSPFSRTVTVKK